ncbi:transketolase [Lactiplantibacillus plantarum]|uniref:transketolase n=1 Tax=Lactiplantibacillus plantarum TaxID=1590 RepID=UPI003B675FA3
MSFDEMDTKAVNAIRALSIDMIEHAESGHPGMPLDAAPMAYVTYKKHLRIDPKHPNWPNRDRFVLSAGHSSSMLYAMLYLAGYGITVDDLKNFRRLDSLTPGHPELITPGVDAATGPLGQGLGMAVGMAMASKHLGTKYNVDDIKILNSRVYVIASDGDLMEGISHESASLAGHLKLNNLIIMYDSNDVTLDAQASKTLGDDAGERFKAYGWNYLRVEDGNNLDEIDNALKLAEAEQERPTIIEVKTVLGYGSPHAGENTVHGNPLTAGECRQTMHDLGWDYEPFEVPDEVHQRYAEILQEGQQRYVSWQNELHKLKKVNEELAQNFEVNFSNQAATGDISLQYNAGDTEAVRMTVHKLIQKSAHTPLNFWGGSADLSSSNKTYFENDDGFEPGQYQNKNVFYGVREFAQAAAVNGITLFGGSRTFGSTFFVFSDYMKNAIRMAALQRIPAIFAFSHDSIALGQDGPTHQPVEQLDGLRAMPGLTVFRPADAIETQSVWDYALNKNHGPVVIAMSRQALPVLEGSLKYAKECVKRGGYIVSPSGVSNSDGIIIATGSEVSISIEAQTKLKRQNINVEVVSMPSTELFLQQPKSYRDKVLDPTVRNRMSVEMGSTQSWYRFTGLDGVNIGLDHFGASGPVDEIIQRFGFSSENITQTYLQHFRG